MKIARENQPTEKLDRAVAPIRMLQSIEQLRDRATETKHIEAAIGAVRSGSIVSPLDKSSHPPAGFPE
jgi:hypothetical protein